MKQSKVLELVEIGALFDVIDAALDLLGTPFSGAIILAALSPQGKYEHILRVDLAHRLHYVTDGRASHSRTMRKVSEAIEREIYLDVEEASWDTSKVLSLDAAEGGRIYIGIQADYASDRSLELENLLLRIVAHALNMLRPEDEWYRLALQETERRQQDDMNQVEFAVERIFADESRRLIQQWSKWSNRLVRRGYEFPSFFVA